MEKEKKIHMITFLLMVAGGLNWLLLGAFKWEISTLLGGPAGTLGRILFVIIGLATIYELVTHQKTCTICTKEKISATTPTSTPTTPINDGM